VSSAGDESVCRIVRVCCNSPSKWSSRISNEFRPCMRAGFLKAITAANRQADIEIRLGDALVLMIECKANRGRVDRRWERLSRALNEIAEDPEVQAGKIDAARCAEIQPHREARSAGLTVRPGLLIDKNLSIQLPQLVHERGYGCMSATLGLLEKDWHLLERIREEDWTLVTNSVDEFRARYCRKVDPQSANAAFCNGRGDLVARSSPAECAYATSSPAAIAIARRLR
jgi:hypothetical protein